MVLAAQEPAPLDTLGDARVRVVYHPDDVGRAQRFYDDILALPNLPALPAGYPTEATVALAHDEAAFTAFAGGAVPEWGAAVAIPSLRRIVVPVYASNRSRNFEDGRVLLHEWAHLGLYEYLEGSAVPRWFSEGYAEWASAGWNPAEAWRLRLAMALHRAPPMDSLTLGWPARRGEAEIAYLLSATAVEYLVSESGTAGLRSFLDTWRTERNFEVAFRKTYGLTTGQFEEDWQKFVRNRYGWLLVLSESLVFWGLLVLLLGGILWARRGYERERMARLRASEPASNPDYWNVPPSQPPVAATRTSNPESRTGYLSTRWSGGHPPHSTYGTPPRPETGSGRDDPTPAEDPQE